MPLSAEQLRLMSKGRPREIIALLANETELSARDMARRLGRSRTSIYKPLDRLLDAGMIKQVGARAGPGSPPSALYALASPLYKPSPEAFSTQKGSDAYVRAAKRDASAASRRFESAVAGGVARAFNADANVGLHSADLLFDRASLVKFNEGLADFLAWARNLSARSDKTAEGVTLTILIAPTSTGVARRGKDAGKGPAA
jgi:DNA-binding Lrp family transcriptional regulator